MISIAQKENHITVYITANIINTSTERVDLVSLKRSITSQLATVYKRQAGRYRLNLHIDTEVLYHVRDCSPTNVLFQIVDKIAGENPAEADFMGLRIKLNKTTVNEMVYNRNIRTIPHEIGHLFGWDHPHARGTYESVNPEAHPLEKQLTEEERRHNLMSQGWYAQKAGIPLDRAMDITEKQIDLLLLNYHSKKLNRNFHLKGKFFWKKLID